MAVRPSSVRGARIAVLLLAISGALQSCVSSPDAMHHNQPADAHSGPGFAVSLLTVGPSALSYGQTVRFELWSAQDGFAHLYSIDPSGRVMAWSENLPIEAGSAQSYPAIGGRLTLRAGPPAGEERVILLVTRNAFTGFDHQSQPTGTLPRVLPYDAEEFLRALERATQAEPDKSWARADIRLRILDPASPT